MRYDAEHKQKTHDKVVRVAARAIRAEGPDRVGVAGVMAQAGLTHGGFYAHFSSKDELVTAAIGEMLAQGRARQRHEMDGRGPAEGLAAYIDFYLSPAHRDDRSKGCPMAALASDLPRLSEDTRRLFADGTRHLADTLAGKLRALGHDDAAAEAHSAVAELIGALLLARIEPDATRSDVILAGSRRLLKRRLGLEAAT